MCIQKIVAMLVGEQMIEYLNSYVGLVHLIYV